MNYYDNAMEMHDIKRIDKLNALVDLSTYWDDVRKLTKRIYSDHSIHRWECLADVRYKELCRLNRVCPLCGAKLNSMVYTDGIYGYVCESCFKELHKGHLSETEFYALLAKEANNGN